ncbi:MAG: OmpH family outer membrane protein [Verrucomicrobia bacterium]|nr:OmpH family outer membrane protein [Verrucomicrobiota bacterium]MBM3869465.1 OmpH family outer membrane protein [Verrucomicrobiota bacterium]
MLHFRASILKPTQLRLLIGVVAVAWFGLTAQAADRIAIVDLKKVFDGYWKTKQADLNLKERAGELDKKRKDMIDDLKKSGDEYKKLVDSSTDSTVSLEERDRRKKSAETKLRELQEIEQSIRQFDQGARAQLGEQQRNMRDKIVVEIRDLVNKKAKTAGYAAVLDSAAESAAGTPILLFNVNLPDLTEEVISQLNATAPAGALVNPGTPAPVRPK